MTLNQKTLAGLLGSRPFQYHDQVDSTNDLAQNWLRAGAPAGAVVIADEQLKGRGRRGHFWHTPPGVALAVSVMLRPDRAALHQVTLLGALAIAETLIALGATDVGIKWANDVLLNGRKVSGVLSESIWDGDQLVGAVLGMGVNVRVDFSNTDLAAKAISIEPALGMQVNRAEVLAKLLSRVDFWAAQLGTRALFQAWRSRLVTPGQQVTVIDEQTTISGTAVDVDEQGALLVRDGAGVLRRVIAGDLEIV